MLCQNIPVIEPVVVVLKKFLAIKDMNTPYKGGLSSYSLILLVHALLKTKNLNLYDPKNPKNYSVGRVFFEFLNYYGSSFDSRLFMVDMSTEISEIETPAGN